MNGEGMMKDRKASVNRNTGGLNQLQPNLDF